jgi:hypothetical protein
MTARLVSPAGRFCSSGSCSCDACPCCKPWVFDKPARCHQPPNQRSCSSLFAMLGFRWDLGSAAVLAYLIPWSGAFAFRAAGLGVQAPGGGLGATPPIQSS